MSKQTSDADKLLAVCRVVWPSADIYESLEMQMVQVATPGSEHLWLDPTDIASLRRVLLALDKAQRSAFNHRFSLLMEQKKNGNICRPSPSRTLTAPTTQILDALHRAVCPE